MKKQLLSIFAAVAVSTVFAQTPSPSWATSQNAGYPITSAGIKFMDAVDANVVWTIALDGTAPARNYNMFSRTSNGGSTFTYGNIFADTNNYVIANMEAVDANTAWVCAFQRTAPYTSGNPGGGVVYRTTNGGTSWQNMTPSGALTNTAQSFADFVSFFTPQVGIFVGDPINSVYEIWRTTNGGLSWSPVPSASIPAPSSATEYAITNLYSRQGTSNLWFGTNEGRVFRTTDAGLTWNSSVVTVASTTITQVAFSTPLLGIVYARSAGNNNEVYHTFDGGITWSQIVTLSPNMGFNDLKGIPGTSYFASCDNANTLISYSSDNGTTWTSWGGTGIPYLTFDFVNATTAWAGSFSDVSNPALGGIWKFTGTVTAGPTPPTAAFYVAPALCGPNVTVSPVNNSTGTAPLTYTWSALPAGVAFSSTTAATPVITFTANNTYTISLTTVASGSTNVSTQVITVSACTPPTAAFTTATISCANVSFTTSNTSTPGTPAASYSWIATPSTGVMFSPSPIAFDPTVKFTTAGVYTITLITTNSSGSVQKSQEVTITDCAPHADITIVPAACIGETITAQNTTSVNALGGGTIVYVWTISPNVTSSAVGTGTAISRAYNFTNTALALPRTFTIVLKATNQVGVSSTTRTIVIDKCTGVAQIADLESNLNVYPNPAHDVLNITSASAETATVKLLNVLGAVVLEEKLNKTATLNLAGKAKGVYFLSVESNGEKVTRKIIID